MLEGYPSGQRGQTVNLLAAPTEVRILPPPPSSSAKGPKGKTVDLASGGMPFEAPTLGLFVLPEEHRGTARRKANVQRNP
jgi:hypothetical protein